VQGSRLGRDRRGSMVGHQGFRLLHPGSDYKHRSRSPLFYVLQDAPLSDTGSGSRCVIASSSRGDSACATIPGVCLKGERVSSKMHLPSHPL